MRLISLFLTFFFWNILGFAQSFFPELSTETISGESAMVPGQFKGRFVFIGVGGSKKAEDNLRSWQNPVYNKFIAKTGLMDNMYDVEVCFLPLFTGAAKASKNQVIKKLEQNNEKLVLDHVYVYSGKKEPFEKLGVENKKEPFFFLLNPEGIVVWSAKGSFRQSYFDEIEDILTQ